MRQPQDEKEGDKEKEKQEREKQMGRVEADNIKNLWEERLASFWNISLGPFIVN